MDPIVFDKISKKYELVSGRPVLLKNIFIPQKKNSVWALKNVSLKIKIGETVGIIGSNGSGKSTLLKILAGITIPTSGKVNINGKAGSLIELGAGFHPDLTGRENVYLNASLLGMTKEEINNKFKDIINFADIGGYIDQPVRTYSSGMVVRLGFAVAIHMEPDILLVDEVLAVGDSLFQAKCLEVFRLMQKQGKVIILVSHNLALIEQFCSRAILLDNGTIISSGETKKVIDGYKKRVNKERIKLPKRQILGAASALQITKVTLARNIFLGQDLMINIDYKINRALSDPSIGISIFSQDGSYIFGTNSDIDMFKLNGQNGHSQITLRLNNLQLLEGTYYLSVGAAVSNDWVHPVDQINNAGYFCLKSGPAYKKFEGCLFIKHQWQKK